MRITVLTAALNAVRTLPDCLASVASQRLPDDVALEHLVLDGGSTDGTVELLEGWREGGDGGKAESGKLKAEIEKSKRSGDPDRVGAESGKQKDEIEKSERSEDPDRVGADHRRDGIARGRPRGGGTRQDETTGRSRGNAEWESRSGDAAVTDRLYSGKRGAGGRRFVSRRDGGFYEALNAGLGEATGDIVGLLNADDFLYDAEALARVAEAFGDPAVQGVYGDLVYVAAESGPGQFQITRSWRAGIQHPHSFLRGWMPPHPTVYVRRAVYEASGGYRTDFGSAADYEWLLRVMVRDGTPFRYIPHRQVAMRAGGMSNRSLRARILANQNDRRAWVVNGLRPHPWTLLLKPLRKLPQWVVGEK
jgi:glycosyltransferase involved in cell wall biosynthesis